MNVVKPRAMGRVKEEICGGGGGGNRNKARERGRGWRLLRRKDSVPSSEVHKPQMLCAHYISVPRLEQVTVIYAELSGDKAEFPANPLRGEWLCIRRVRHLFIPKGRIE